MAQAPTLGFGCAICSDAFDVNAQRNICTIPSCGHVYHEYCLKRWFRTQIRQSVRSSCPKCRVPATANQVIRLFLHQTIAGAEDNDTTTQEFDEEDENSDVDSDEARDRDIVELLVEFSDDLTFSDDEDSMPDIPVPNFNAPQQITLADNIDENDADSSAQLWEMKSEEELILDMKYFICFFIFCRMPPLIPLYPSLLDHANELYVLDQRLRLLHTDLSAMVDMVNGLESYVQTLN